MITANSIHMRVGMFQIFQLPNFDRCLRNLGINLYNVFFYQVSGNFKCYRVSIPKTDYFYSSGVYNALMYPFITPLLNSVECKSKWWNGFNT